MLENLLPIALLLKQQNIKSYPKNHLNITLANNFSYTIVIG